jgi:hypothetical protein
MSLDFAAHVDHALAAGRSLAESLMTATCLITADGVGEPVFDDETGQYVEPERVTVYEGKCRVQIPGDRTASNEAEAGDREISTQEPELQLPVVGSEAVAVGHQALIVSNPRDTALVDRVFTVIGPHAKSQATARRLRVIEVTG